MPRSNHLLLVVACFVSALLGGLAGRLLEADRTTGEGPPAETGEIRLRSFASSAPTDFIQASERAIPAVVSVRSFLRAGLTDDLGLGGITSGSAVIISPDGYIATNNHVIEGARRIRVTLRDRREFDARVIGVDESTDLALLKVAADSLPSLAFGNSDSVRVGEWVLAVGNPYSLNSTVTTGIVSAKGRSIDVLETEDRIESFIQTDAAVNPGNSGGALVNTAGELVGINTAIISNSGRHEGYAFAIPGNLASRVLDDLKEYGEVKRAFLGVWIQGINDAQAKRLQLTAARGALITDLNPTGPAARAGLRIGDVMTAINEVEINSSPEMQEQLSRYRPGQRIRVTYIRNAITRTISILLRDKSNRSGKLVSERFDDILHVLGFAVRPLTEAERGLSSDGGIRVTAIYRNSPIERSNMESGFIITTINGYPVADMNTFVGIVRRVGELTFGGFYEDYEGEYYYRLP